MFTAIIPVYNERPTVSKIISLVESKSPNIQIIVVDDGSNDGTAQILAKWVDSDTTTVLRHEKNQGKGAAIRTALPHATGKFTIIQDADLEYSPADYDNIFEPLVSEHSQIVYGSRFLPDSTSTGTGKIIPRFGVRLLNRIAKLLYGTCLTDLATCYKAFPTELLRQMDLQSQGFEFCAEVTAKACRLGIPILEVPIQYTPRSAKEGKKIRWWHGLSMLRTLWTYRHWNLPTSKTTAVH